MAIRVMIADDFQLLREDLRDTLSAQPDIEVVGLAGSGREACALAETTDFDIFLMDIEMESLKAGIEATEQILLDKPEAKVIFLTAHDSEDMVLTSMGAGAVDYLVKGGSEELLLEHIRAAYNGEPLLETRVQKLVMQEFSRLRRSEQSLLFFINKVAQLTPAERQLVRFLLDGYKLREIAAIRCVEMPTVKTQIRSLLHKFNCKRSSEIVELVRSLRVDHLF
ncbi:MAG: response regulator transcription factor [Clostridia bacterium]|nr:response regulator transcription factor [Clostridia bacterium]